MLPTVLLAASFRLAGARPLTPTAWAPTFAAGTVIVNLKLPRPLTDALDRAMALSSQVI